MVFTSLTDKTPLLTRVSCHTTEDSFKLKTSHEVFDLIPNNLHWENHNVIGDI